MMAGSFDTSLAWKLRPHACPKEERGKHQFTAMSNFKQVVQSVPSPSLERDCLFGKSNSRVILPTRESTICSSRKKWSMGRAPWGQLGSPDKGGACVLS